MKTCQDLIFLFLRPVSGKRWINGKGKQWRKGEKITPPPSSHPFDLIALSHAVFLSGCLSSKVYTTAPSCLVFVCVFWPTHFYVHTSSSLNASLLLLNFSYFVLHCCLGLHLISYSSHCFLDFYYEVSGYVVLITSFI